MVVDIGDRIAGLNEKYIYRWKTKPADTVKFDRSNKMRERGIWLTKDDYGIGIKSGLGIHIR